MAFIFNILFIFILLSSSIFILIYISIFIIIFSVVVEHARKEEPELIGSVLKLLL